MKKTHYFTVLLLLFFVPVLKTAAQEPIDSDRPDQSENTHTLSPGELQLETGVLVNGYDEGRTSLIGSALLRYGLIQGIETRLMLEDGNNAQKYFRQTAQGRYQASLSTKFQFLEGHRTLPDVTLVSYLNLPFLSGNDANVNWAPSFILAMERKISSWTILANGGINFDAFEKGHSYQATGGLSYQIGERWKVFGEYYGQFKEGEETLNNADTGLLYQIGNNTQIDFAVGSSIFSAERNSFATMGLTLRF